MTYPNLEHVYKKALQQPEYKSEFVVVVAVYAIQKLYLSEI